MITYNHIIIRIMIIIILSLYFSLKSEREREINELREKFPITLFI